MFLLAYFFLVGNHFKLNINLCFGSGCLEERFMHVQIHFVTFFAGPNRWKMIDDLIWETKLQFLKSTMLHKTNMTGSSERRRA